MTSLDEREVTRSDGVQLPDCLTEDTLRELGGVLNSYARRAVGDPDLAADLVQETALAAMRGAGSFEGRSSLRSWLLGILSHKVMDHHRRVKRAPALQPADDKELTARGPSPERRAQGKQALDIVERALQDVPHTERLAVLLVDVEGMSRQEACNAMDVRPTHLRVLLHRGRHRLRRALTDAGMSPHT